MLAARLASVLATECLRKPALFNSARRNMYLNAADENKGVLLRKQSVPHWKKWNQVCDNQTGDEFRGRQRAWSCVSVDTGWLASASCSHAVARPTRSPVLYRCISQRQCTQSSTYPKHADDAVADTQCFEMTMFSLPVLVFFLNLSL